MTEPARRDHDAMLESIDGKLTELLELAHAATEALENAKKRAGQGLTLLARFLR